MTGTESAVFTRSLGRRVPCRHACVAVLWTFFFSCLPLPALASFKQRDTGSNAAQFLKLGPDARGVAMGQAVRALADDATAVHWNPAGLATLNTRSAVFSHGSYIHGVFLDSLSYAQPVEAFLGRKRSRDIRETQLGGVGVSFLYLNAGSFQEVDNTGTETGAAFTPQEFAGSIAWGGSLGRRLDLGIAMKYVYSKLHDGAGAAAGDAGARLRLKLWRFPLTLSAGAHNFGGSLRYVKQTQDLPFFVSAGASVRLLRSLTVTGEVIAPRDNRVYGAAGAEYRQDLTKQIAVSLRGGYNGMNYYDDLAGLATLSAGGGVRLYSFDIDYAWTPFGILDDAHRFSLSYRF